mgnify:CR=1 FL=1
MSKVLASLPKGEKVGIAFSGGLDTSVAVISRIARGISPLTGGKDHLSHRLMKHGLTKKKTAYALWTLTLLFSLISVLIQVIPNLYFNLVVFVALLFWLFLFVKFIRIKI